MDEGYIRVCRKDNVVIWGEGLGREWVPCGRCEYCPAGWVAELDISITL